MWGVERAYAASRFVFIQVNLGRGGRHRVFVLTMGLARRQRNQRKRTHIGRFADVWSMASHHELPATLLHQALREALVNTLVHADYSDRASVRVIKRPSGFEFRNPGALRVTVAQALQGGESDCRNRTLQQMFLMINLGERAGSGLPRILTSWQSEGRLLKMTELFEPYDQSLLTMDWKSSKTSGKTSGKTLKASGKTSGKTTLEILNLIKQDENLTIAELSVALEISERSIEKALQSLREDGRLERQGPAKGGIWKILKR